ncbi:TAXI family TRAP transporter solute-binding subunit [Rhodobacteraceae bacterium D3-12]|nr:TAXI family TRAP transporter solute-binding subunit [Rhodobacteraceae bacterium D3-12]
MKHFIKRVAVMFSVAGLVASPAIGQEEVAIPDTMIWTTLDVGSSGHAEASALADALMKENKTRIRIRPAGSAPARLLPMKSGQATHGMLANEAYFASEGIQGFEDRAWGPQNLRVIMARPAVYGLVTTKESGIKNLADIRGKRFAYVVGQPGINVKNDALLAYAGLTRDDVQVLEMPNYSSSIRALAEGRADVAGSVPTAGVLRELEASPDGLAWVRFGDGNWDELQRIVPFFTRQSWGVGPGLSEEVPGDMVGYRYPIIATYANANADEVYALTKAIMGGVDGFASALAGMENYTPEKAGTPPVDVPFHEGAIRFYKETGAWTEEHDAWNEGRLTRLRALRAAWDKLVDGRGAGMREADFSAAWLEARDSVLNELK